MENYSDMHASLTKNFESILEINASLEQVHVRINNMEKQIASIIKNRDNIRSYLKKMPDLDLSFRATLTEDLEIKQ